MSVKRRDEAERADINTGVPMKLPKVMLLGDSIRLSYQPLVAERLAGKAEVVGPQINGQFAL